MYEVIIINYNKEIVINSMSTDKNANRITGAFKQGINTIDSFTFRITPNNSGYNYLHPFKTLINIVNTKTKEVEFRGRVLLPSPSMAANGMMFKNVVCESELAYLTDSTTRYGEYHNISVRQYLELVIDNHNKNVELEKRFEVGIITVKDNNDSLYRYLNYEETFTAIQDDLIDKLGGELRIRHDNGVRYLDYLEEVGEKSTVEIRLAKNLQTIKQELDPSQIISRLVVLGAKNNDSDERLTIKSVNAGVDYIDDVEAIKEFGIIQRPVIFDDVTIANNLLSKGNEYLKSNNKIKRKHDIEALDLFTIDLDHQSFRVGNYHKIINPIMFIDDELRIIAKTTDINSPWNGSLTVGDKFDDIKDYQAKIKKKNKKIENDAVDARLKVEKVNGNLDNTNKELTQTSYDLKKQKKYIIMGV
ncbi:MAG: phage tail protein [Clostridium sp.]